MYKNLFERSLIGRDRAMVDGRDIVLNVFFNWSNPNSVLETANKIYQKLLLSYTDNFILDIGVSFKSNISKGNVMSIFESSFNKRGYGSFYFDGILKSEQIKTKKMYRNWLESGVIEGKSIQEHFVSTKKILYLLRKKKIEELAKTIKAIDEVKYFRELVKSILYAECKTEDYLSFPLHSDIGFNFSVWKCEESRTLYQGCLKLYISVFSVKSNENKMAECLWEIGKSFCNDCPNSSAFVTLNNERGKEYSSPVMDYFNHFDEGIVFDFDTKNLYDVMTYLNLQYIEGLEWANIIAPQVAAKITDIDEVKETWSEFYVDKLENGAVIIKNKKGIMQHRARDFELHYEHFKKCLRPGYSEHSVFDIRQGWDEAFVNPNEYLVQDSKVYFRRGNFDFITKRY